MWTFKRVLSLGFSMMIHWERCCSGSSTNDSQDMRKMLQWFLHQRFPGHGKDVVFFLSPLSLTELLEFLELLVWISGTLPFFFETNPSVLLWCSFYNGHSLVPQVRTSLLCWVKSCPLTGTWKSALGRGLA